MYLAPIHISVPVSTLGLLAFVVLLCCCFYLLPGGSSFKIVLTSTPCFPTTFRLCVATSTSFGSFAFFLKGAPFILCLHTTRPWLTFLVARSHLSISTDFLCFCVLHFVIFVPSSLDPRFTLARAASFSLHFACFLVSFPFSRRPSFSEISATGGLCGSSPFRFRIFHFCQCPPV